MVRAKVVEANRLFIRDLQAGGAGLPVTTTLMVLESVPLHIPPAG